MSAESEIAGIVQNGLFLAGILLIGGIFISIPTGIVLIFLKDHKNFGIFLALWPLVLVAGILLFFFAANFLM